MLRQLSEGVNHLHVLRQRGYDGMSANSWISEVLEELATRCPVTNSISAALLETNIQSEKNTNDEAVISADCQSLKPFQKQNGRAFESFMNISDNPTSSIDQAKFDAKTFLFTTQLQMTQI